MAWHKKTKTQRVLAFTSHFNGLEEIVLNELPAIQVQTPYLKTVTKNLLGIWIVISPTDNQFFVIFFLMEKGRTKKKIIATRESKIQFFSKLEGKKLRN